MNKKILIVITILSVVLLAVTLYFSFRPQKQPENKEELKAQQTATEFIKDFSTYKMSDTADYNSRIKKYISPEYLASFEERFSLPEQKFVAQEEISNYSTYDSSQILDSVSEDDRSEVNLKYTVKKVDAPGAPNPFMETKSVFIIFENSNGTFLVTHLDFETE